MKKCGSDKSKITTKKKRGLVMNQEMFSRYRDTGACVKDVIRRHHKKTIWRRGHPEFNVVREWDTYEFPRKEKKEMV